MVEFCCRVGEVKINTKPKIDGLVSKRESVFASTILILMSTKIWLKNQWTYMISSWVVANCDPFFFLFINFLNTQEPGNYEFFSCQRKWTWKCLLMTLQLNFAVLLKSSEKAWSESTTHPWIYRKSCKKYLKKWMTHSSQLTTKKAKTW